MRKNKAKHLILITLFATIITMMAVCCASAASVSNASAKVNGSLVNLRKSTSTSSKSLALLKDNTKLTVKKVVFTTKTKTGSKYRWFYVTAGSKTGYIRSDCVDNLKYTSVSATTTDALNYRKGAGASMSKVGTYKKGKKIQVILKASDSKSVGWYKVKEGSKYYYVNDDYVKLTSSSATPETTKEETADTVKFTKSGVNYPTTLTVGQTYSIKGTVTCNKKISKVTFGIVDSDGYFVEYVTKNINSKTFNISTVDNNIHFGRLVQGSYKYAGHFYVGDTCYKSVVRYSFDVNGPKQTLTDKIVKARINEIVTALDGKYFTTNGKACNESVADACNVCNVITKNSTVANLIKKNKGSGKVNTSLFPHHYTPTGDTLTLGWSCCGFAGFAGWYIGADNINSSVQYMPIKVGCNYDKSTMSKYARIGDLVRTRTHSFMIVSVGSDGCEVIDSNWGCTCKFNKHTIKYTQYDIVTISRATIRK